MGRYLNGLNLAEPVGRSVRVFHSETSQVAFSKKKGFRKRQRARVPGPPRWPSIHPCCHPRTILAASNASQFRSQTSCLCSTVAELSSRPPSLGSKGEQPTFAWFRVHNRRVSQHLARVPSSARLWIARSPSVKFSATGDLYLSTYRITFVAKKPTPRMQMLSSSRAAACDSSCGCSMGWRRVFCIRPAFGDDARREIRTAHFWMQSS